MTTMKDWEKKVLAAPGAPERVEHIEEELRLAAALTALRERAGLSQRELAERIGVRQPRIAAIERSRNVTFDVLERYVSALGGQLELSVLQDGRKTALLSSRRAPAAATKNVIVKAETRKTAAKTTSARKTRVKPTAAAASTSGTRTTGKQSA